MLITPELLEIRRQKDEREREMIRRRAESINSSMSMARNLDEKDMGRKLDEKDMEKLFGFIREDCGKGEQG